MKPKQMKAETVLSYAEKYKKEIAIGTLVVLAVILLVILF